MPSKDTAQGKARARAREGGRPGHNLAQQQIGAVRRMPTHAWEDVEDDLTWIGDFEGGVQQIQMTANVSIMTLHIPISYIPRVVELGQAMVPTIFFRAYIPPPPPNYTMEIEDGEQD